MTTNITKTISANITTEINVYFYFRSFEFRNNYILTDPVADFIHWLIVFIITPAISILGIIGNVLSLLVIAKQGFKKSSNILIFSLAVSDILFMLGINGAPKPMYEWGDGGFAYPEHTARILYYLYQFFDSLNWTTGATSVTIPALITLERFIAVFFPLKFAALVTPRRTIFAIMVTFISSIAIQIYTRTWFQFAYTFDPARNVSVGLAQKTNIYWSHRKVVKVIELFINLFVILVVFVACGSIAIGFKMRMVAKKRMKMTNSLIGQKGTKGDTGTSRTTKMLLYLCICYTIACTPIGFPAILPGFMVLPVFEDEPNFRSMGMFFYHIYKFFFCLNSSSNFVIFMASNKQFRDTLRVLLKCHKGLHHK